MSGSARTPPRFVPTLTEVVHTDGAGAEPAPFVDMLAVPAQPLDRSHDTTPVYSPPSPGVLEEEIVHRVMQRVDVSLEHRLREAIALVIQEQTRSVVPRLREEIESVVRQSVYEAVADELAHVASTHAGNGA